MSHVSTITLNLIGLRQRLTEPELTVSARFTAEEAHKIHLSLSFSAVFIGLQSPAWLFLSSWRFRLSFSCLTRTCSLTTVSLPSFGVLHS